MTSEFKKKNEDINGTKGIRLDVPATINRKAKAHRIKMIGKLRREVTLAEAMIDLLDKATKNIQPAES